MRDEEIERLAEKISRHVSREIRDDLYREIGKGFINRLAWFVGIAFSALIGYLGGKHIL